MAPINYLCLSLIIGIFISSLVSVPPGAASGVAFLYLLFLFLGLAALLVLRYRKSARVFWLTLTIFYLLGLVRPQLSIKMPEVVSRIFPVIYISRTSGQIQTAIKTVLDRNLPEPQSSLAYGMLFGNKSKFDRTFMNDLRRTGTAHMVAVSGYNVSVMVNVLLNTSILLISRAFLVLGFGALFFYDVLVGFSASVTRATIMGVYLFAAGLLGRQKSLADALLASAAIILLVAPESLFDLGFQLSFLSMMGVMYISPLFEKLLSLVKIPAGEWRLAVSSTLASQLIILPVSLYNFGQISLISPVANVLTFLTVPIIMALTALQLVTGYLMAPLVWIFSQANLVVLNYFVSVISYLSSLPWAAVTF